MTMTLNVPSDIAEAAREAAARSGVHPDEILLDALRAHFPPIPEGLLAEFNALERASDEDMLRFEHTFGPI